MFLNSSVTVNTSLPVGASVVSRKQRAAAGGAVLTAHGATAPMQRTTGLYATCGCSDTVRDRIERKTPAGLPVTPGRRPRISGSRATPPGLPRAGACRPRSGWRRAALAACGRTKRRRARSAWQAPMGWLMCWILGNYRATRCDGRHSESFFRQRPALTPTAHH